MLDSSVVRAGGSYTVCAAKYAGLTPETSENAIQRHPLYPFSPLYL